MEFKVPSTITRDEDRRDPLTQQTTPAPRRGPRLVPQADATVSDFKVPEWIRTDAQIEQVKLDDAMAHNPTQYADDKRRARTTGLPLSIVQENEPLQQKLAGANLRRKLRDTDFAARWFGQGDNARLTHDVVDELVEADGTAAAVARPDYNDEEQSWVEATSLAIGERAIRLGGLVTQFGATLDEEMFGSTLKDVAMELEAALPLGYIQMGDEQGVPPDALLLMELNGTKFYHVPSSADRQEKYAASTDNPLADVGAALSEFEIGDQIDERAMEQVWNDNPLAIIPWATQQGLASAADILGVVLSLPIYAAARATEMGNERGSFEGRDRAAMTDIIEAAPTAIASAALERFAGKKILGISDDLAAPTILGILGAAGKGAAIEAATEAGQETIEYFGTRIGTIEDVSAKEATEIAFQAAVVGGIFGGDVRLVTATAQAGLEARRSKTRTEAVRNMNAANPSLRARDPETFANFQSEALRAQGVEDVRVSADGINILMQEVGGREEAIRQGYVTGASATESELGGNGVQLSLEKFWSLPQETIEKLAPHVAFNAAELTEAEAVDVAEVLAEQNKADFQAAVDTMRETVTEDDAVFQQVYDQLISEGTAFSGDPNAATAAAEQMAAAFRVLAERSGKSVEELAGKFLPTIRKETRIPIGPATFEQATQGFVDDAPAELQAAAQARMAGEITQAEYDAQVNAFKPILPYESVPTPASEDKMRAALTKGQQGRVGKGIEWLGKLVGLRLDIPAYTRHDTWVPTMHDPAGKPVAHEAAAKITGATFTQPGESAERKAAKVGAEGVSKSPFAQINGTLQSVDPDTLVAEMEAALNDPAWTQVGYDPRRHTFFYDRKTQRPVLSADEVIQVGPLVLAKNAQFGSGADFLFQTAEAPMTERKQNPQVADGNKHGLMPYLRDWSEAEPRRAKKQAVVQKSNNKNARSELDKVDEVLAMNPDAHTSVRAWKQMMADAYGEQDVPIAPYRFIEEINSNGVVQNLSRLSEGQIADADHGFENARDFREAYTSGKLGVETTGKLFLWSFLSRGVSPYTQESLFIDAFPGIDKWMAQAAAGEFDVKGYTEWAKSVAPKGSGQPGAGATHNLNAFGKDFLVKMSQDVGDGRSKLQYLHDLMSDPATTGKQVRREFAAIGEGVGIDNKVVSFTLLVAGYNDVMVLDRVQFRQLFNDGRYDGVNLYDGFKQEGAVVTGSGFAKQGDGVRGILIYEAIERAIEARIDDIYRQLGREGQGSVGRYHWETWVADSQQEASHGSLAAILPDALGAANAINEVSAKQGEYGNYAYGARYGVTGDGISHFTYSTPSGKVWIFTVPQFVEFQQEIKKPKNGVVPKKFKVTEAGNAPWYNQEQIDTEALDRVAASLAEGEAGDRTGTVRRNGKDEDLSAGSPADQAKLLFQLEAPSLRALFEAGADFDRLLSHPDVVAALEQMYSIPITSERDGYMSEPWKRGRLYNNGIVGFDAVVERMVENTAGHTNEVLQGNEVHIVLGPPASGKSSAIAEPLAEAIGARVVDSDDAKKLIPEFQGGVGANAVHEESSAITEEALRRLLPTQDNLVLPLVGANLESMRKRVKALKAAGKTVYVHNMGLSLDEAHRRNIGRFIFSGRLVPPQYLEGVGVKPSATYTALLEEGDADGYADYNNEVPIGQQPVLNAQEGVEVAASYAEEAGVDRGRDGDGARPGAVEQRLEQQARGSIDFRDMQDIVIRLYEAENLSTFLHESGHLYLEMLGTLASEPDAAPQLQEDFQTILDWFGVDSREQIGVDQHEKFAETFEEYLREGKAPSPALERAFRKFMAWLTTIYKRATSIGKRRELTPEIRDVLDRLLATDAEIENARVMANLVPAFKDFEASGMTEEEYTAYAESYQNAQQAQAELIQETYAEVRREQQKWWNEERAKEEELALQRLDADPVWQARYSLQTGNLPSGAPRADERPHVKLNSKAVGDRSLPGGTRIISKTGSEPEAVAQDFGFDSADHLLTELENMPKDVNGKFHTAQSFAAEQAQKIMLDRYGDLTDPARLADEAMIKVHSQQQSQVLGRELEHLARLSNSSRRVNNKILKAAARRMIDEKTIAEIESPTKFLNAERRAAIKAAEAIAKGDPQTAFKYKTQQILNFHLYREARDARAKADKMTAQLRKYQTRKLDPNKVHPTFIKKLKELVADIDFRGPLAGERIARLSTETLQAWAEEQTKEFGASFHIAPNLEDALTKPNVRSMKLSELEGLHDTAKSIYTQGRRYSQAEQAQFKSLAQNMEVSVDANAMSSTEDNIDPDWWDGIKGYGRQFMASMRTISSLAIELDGGDRGIVWREIYQRVKQADDRYNDRAMRAGREINDIFNEYTLEEKMRFYRKEFIPELGRSLSLNARLAVALNMGNAGNVEALRNTFTDAQIRAIGESLTSKDWDIVEKLWKHIDGYWPELSALEEKTTGVKPAKVSPSPFTIKTAEGNTRTIAGGYYPLVGDPKQGPKNKADFVEANSINGFMNGGRAKANTKHGSTIERQGFGKAKKVWLDVAVLFNHVDGVIKDVEMREAVMDAHRIISSDEFAGAVRRAKGGDPAYHEVFQDWLKQTVQGAPIATDWMEKGVNYFRTGASIAEMGLSLRTILQQPLGLASSMALVGEKYMTIGTGKFLQDRGQAVREVMEMSSFMRNRAATFNRDVRDAQGQLGLTGLKTPVINFSFKGIQMLDMAVSVPTWLGAYQQAIDNGSKPQDAVDIADDAVSRSQGTGMPRDLSSIQGGGVWKRLFTMFYSYFNAYHNLQSNLYKDARREMSAEGWLRFGRQQLWVTVLPAMVTAAFFGPGMAEDEDDWQDYLRYYGGATLANGFSGLIFLRDVANAINTGFGYQITPAQNALGSLANLAKQLGQGEADAALVRSILLAIGYLGHVPGMRTVARGTGYVWEEGADELDTFDGWWQLLVTGPKD